MRDIKDIRKDIDDIDNGMKDLFLKRMSLSKEVSLYKKSKNIPIYDPIREKEIIDNKVSTIDDKILKSFYNEFIEKILDISKKYQSKINM